MARFGCQHSVDARRRWLAAGAAWPALAWTGALRAQGNPPVLIGWLSGRSAEERDLQNAFNEGMAALGRKHGTHYVLEESHSEGQADRLPALAQELAAKKPVVIVAWPSAAVRAATAAAPTTPVVTTAGDPLAAGLVTSLARPGGMITGPSSMSADTNLKVIEWLMEALPRLQRVAFLADSTQPNHAAIVANARRAAERFRFEAVIAELAKPQDIEPAFVRLAKVKVQAVVMLPSGWMVTFFETIIRLTMAHRWPLVGTSGRIAKQGALFSYSPDGPALARRTATYVDRILKGARPGDLPIEQPTVFDLVLNMKTAKTLGIAIPQSVRLRATEVIE